MWLLPGSARRQRICCTRCTVCPLTGLRLAILGNYLDFSALQGQVSFEKLEDMLDKGLEMELDQTVYCSLCRDLETGRTLLYLTDNAGEIGFDRLFAEEIAKRYPLASDRASPAK